MTLQQDDRKEIPDAENGKKMTQGAAWKHILKFFLPVLAGMILQQLYTTADTFIVGNFTGQKALAAVGTTNTLVFFFLSIAIGFSAGNGVLVSQHFGAEDFARMRKDAASGIIFLVFLGILASAAGIVFSRFAYEKFMAVPAEILDSTLLYFRLYCTGLVFQFAYNIFSAILRSVGDSAATLYFLLLASCLNILLDLVFVAWFRWGVAGAAVATNISQACSAAAAWIYMHRKYKIFRFGFREMKAETAIVFQTFRIGWPIALQLMIVAMGISLIQRAVNGFGEVMTAAFAVGQRIEMFLHLPCNALMTTLATFTGQNAGAGKMDRILSGTRQAVLLSFLFTLILSVPVWLFAYELSALFALENEAHSYCTSYLKAIAVIVIILSLYVPLFGVFQGTRHVIIPAVVALCALSLRVTVTYLLKGRPFPGHTIIWWNGLFGFTLGCTLAWGCYWSRSWQKNISGREEKRKEKTKGYA